MQNQSQFEKPFAGWSAMPVVTAAQAVFYSDHQVWFKGIWQRQRQAVRKTNLQSAVLTVLLWFVTYTVHSATVAGAPPAITRQPLSQTVAPGSDVILSVAATGSPVPQYRWALNGDYIPDATGSMLTLTNVQSVDGGNYKVTVYNEWGTVDSADARLQVSVPLLPFADSFSARGTINSLSGTGRGSNVSATKETGEPRHAGKDYQRTVWLAWLAPVSGIAKVSTAGSDFDTLMAVYTGSAINALTEVGSDDDLGDYHTSLVQFNAQAGVQYQIAIAGLGYAVGNIVLNWELVPSLIPLPVILDAPTNTTAAFGASATLSVNFSSALPTSVQWFFEGQALEGQNGPALTLLNCDANRVGRYSVRLSSGNREVFSPPAEVQINTEGLTMVGARNKPADAKEAGLIPSLLNVVKSVLKLIGLNSYHRSQPQSVTAVRGYTGTQIFTTSPGKDQGEPNHCGIVGGASYWFTYQAPETGILSLNTDGSNFDTILAVYVDNGSGQGYASLASVSCDNNSGTDGKDSSLSFQATGGSVYYVVVDGVNGVTGTVNLNYNLNALPTISSIANQTVNEDTSTPAISFTIGDRETPATSLILTSSSSNPTVVPNASITCGGSGSTRTVTVRPATNKFGTVTVTVNCTDSGGAMRSCSFTVTVNPVNDAPVPNADMGSRYPSQSLQFYIPTLLSNDSDVDGNVITLSSVAGQSANNAMITKNGSYITYTPPSGFNSKDTFTYSISDGKGGIATGKVYIYMRDPNTGATMF